MKAEPYRGVPPPLMEESRHRNLPAMVAAAAVVGSITVLFTFNPTESDFYPVCLFHKTTGLHCPGCGSLRALHQLLHGHLVAAFHFNAVLVIALPLLGWFAARMALHKFKNAPAPQILPGWLWAALAVLLLFGVVRNLPFSCFSWLAPQ